MKAKDTVMTDEQLIRLRDTHLSYPEELLIHERDTAKAQAEKTWPLAFKAGIKEVVECSKELLEIGRKAIEDTLIEWRDNRLSEFTRGNGLVIREKDGRDSSIIRFGPETALRIGLKAMFRAKLKEWGIE